MSMDYPVPKIPAGVTIMEQFKLLIDSLAKYEAGGKKTGVVNRASFAAALEPRNGGAFAKDRECADPIPRM